MGNTMSEAERKQKEKELRAAFVARIPKGPNLTVNKSIVMFCSVSASENLKLYFEEKKKGQVDAKEAAAVLKSIVEKLGGLVPAPALAGIGSMAIGIFIDAAFASPPEQSTKEALRSVFAEEKASEVWDQIDECLKRCMMNIKDEEELRDDIERIEVDLSAALTKLKNSMVRDGHMNNQALEAWVNGAAFHIQVMIHLVRLGEVKSCDPVRSLLLSYKADLEPLFKKHYEFIQGKCTRGVIAGGGPYPPRTLVDEESKSHVIDMFGDYNQYFEAYYEHRYSVQKVQIQKYFKDVEENLQQLVEQKGFFKV